MRNEKIPWSFGRKSTYILGVGAYYPPGIMVLLGRRARAWARQPLGMGISNNNQLSGEYQARARTALRVITGIGGRGVQAVCPPHELPAPAVQPKQ